MLRNEAAGAAKKTGGLAGIVAGETKICTVGSQADDLRYRGYSIKDFCKNPQFEEVAFLLIYGKLPNQAELKAYLADLKSKRGLPDSVKNVLKLLPAQAHPMDVLRTACSFLGSIEPEGPKNTAQDIANRLLSFFPSALLYWYHFHKTGKELNLNMQSENIASYFLDLLAQTTDVPQDKKLIQNALNVSLILYAEHEFNASTFAARTCVSTKSDFYSGIVTGIGTLSGPLHGGANEQAMKLIQEFKTPEAAVEGVTQKLDNKQTVMGFGHRVYKGHDPRSDIMKQYAELLSNKFGDKSKDSPDLFAIAQAIEQTVFDKIKKYPNTDFYSALVYHFLGIPTELFTPLFVMSRTSGWSAHIQEERAASKLIRPAASYTGPEAQEYVPIEERQGAELEPAKPRGPR